MTDTLHPTWDELVDLAEGRLAAPEGSVLSSHIAQCTTCGPQILWLRGIMNQLSEDGFHAPPREAHEAVLAAFDRHQNTTTVTPVIPLEGRRRQRWFRAPRAQSGLAAALAATLVLAALFLWRGQQRTFVAAVQEVSGGVQITQLDSAPRPAAEDERLAAGDRIVTEEDGQVQLAFGNGAVALTLLPGSEIRIEQIALGAGQTLERVVTRLEEGEVEVAVQEPGAIALLSYDTTFATQGGRFRLRILEDDSGAIEVYEGEVTAGNEAGSITLQGGESLIIQPGVAPGSLPPAGPAATPTSGTATEPAQSATEAVPETVTVERSASPEGSGSDGEFTGRVEGIPANRVGQWLVGGRAFTSTTATELKEDDGPLRVGACVDVEFAERSRAVEIRTRDADRCDRPDNDDDDDNSGGSSGASPGANSGPGSGPGASGGLSAPPSIIAPSPTSIPPPTNAPPPTSAPPPNSAPPPTNPPAATSAPPPTSAPLPTSAPPPTSGPGDSDDDEGDDDDGGVDDNSGPGSGSEDDGSEDNSGPGSGSDDGDNSGSDDDGDDDSGSDDGDDDDNSGSGGDDDSGDDDSGDDDSGDDDSGDDDDNSGSDDGGDDDKDDDNSGSGSGGDD